jgi:hypothetical protein
MSSIARVRGDVAGVISNGGSIEDMKALGYTGEQIRQASEWEIMGMEFLHLFSALKFAKFFVEDCGCNPKARTRWPNGGKLSVFAENISSEDRTLFYVKEMLSVGIRWLPEENDVVAQALFNPPRDIDISQLCLDYGLRLPPNHRDYPLYVNRLQRRAVSVALLSLWKKRCPAAMHIGKDVLRLVAKRVWKQRFN